jgi:hypothetical protein
LNDIEYRGSWRGNDSPSGLQGDSEPKQAIYSVVQCLQGSELC